MQKKIFLCALLFTQYVCGMEPTPDSMDSSNSSSLIVEVKEMTSHNQSPHTNKMENISASSNNNNSNNNMPPRMPSYFESLVQQYMKEKPLVTLIEPTQLQKICWLGVQFFVAIYFIIIVDKITRVPREDLSSRQTTERLEQEVIYDLITQINKLTRNH